MQQLSADDFLAEMLSTQTTSIAKYQFAEQTVWIKKAEKRHSAWLYNVLKVFTHALGLKALTPVPNLGGQQAIQTEAKRLLELQQHDVHVPQLLAHNTHGLMIADVGSPEQPSIQLEAKFQECGTAQQCLGVLRCVLEEISTVHQHGAWLSEAFLRNILLDGHGNISFIDFESDPRDHMSEALCYARDWLCLMFSVAIYLKRHEVTAEASRILAQSIQKESEATVSAVTAVCRRLNWIQKLPVEKLGKDGLRMTAVANLLKQLEQSLKPLAIV